ncbi:peroxiredoxin [Lyticum sinuosum]|uniref:Thioredoxin peroxidase n=1 Tax=Lyticum sinuosum TaxID=1332059 RepID=A0AAE4VLU3_9RICK|nr:peroxiredoxin [Lyticum sinuosum]MDZ5761023.1 putative alkyl hydroperoxide reductase [Lyticum sinuosum]
MTLVGKKLIDFTSPAIMADNNINENFNLYENINGKKTIIFFYPLNFTFVCPSEIISLNEKIDQFYRLNASVIVISVDSHFSHLTYKKTHPRDGGIGNVNFTMVSDIKKNIAKEYGILYDESIALRATFIADEDKIIRHSVVNDFPLGRNIDEMIRIIEAIDFHKQNGEVCPANWKKGQSGMKPTVDGVRKYLSENFSS